MTPAPLDGEIRTRDSVVLSYTRYPAPPGSPRIALVHSLALDRSLWSRVIDALDGRAEIVAYDCRGHGLSDRPAGPFTVEQFADDLVDLLNRLGWSDVVVAGCSMGGCVAQSFASRYRDRTRAALFVDTTAWYGPSAPRDWARRVETAQAKGLSALVPVQLTRWFGDAFREAEPDLMRRLAEVFTANDLACYEATCRMLGAVDLRAGASAIARPAAVLVGEQDQATPPDMARDLAERIGDGNAVMVRGTRHLTPLENPAIVAGALVKLLERAAAGSAT
jgi:3-oxoadipate enol-lactonase